MPRKSFTVAAACLLLAGAASAQLLPSFGVKGGLNFSSIDVDDLDASARTGYAAGVFVNLVLPGMNLQGEVLYTVKGFEQASVQGLHAFDYRERLIEIPVLMKFALPLPMLSPSFYAGPAVSFPLKGEVKGRGDWVEIDQDAEGMVWSVVFGVDVTLMQSLVLDLRYDWGLSSIRETDFGDVAEFDEDLKDRTISAMVGYRF